jgi:hypothetical protein
LTCQVIKKYHIGVSRELSNVEAVVLAVYRLGGATTPQDTEDIAVEADRLAPGRFRWLKYPEFISDELIRVFLSDAKKPKNGALLAGDGSKGWRLTVAGAKLAALLNPRGSAVGRKRKDRELERRIRIESNRLMEPPAWVHYSRGLEVGRRDAEAVFRVSDYTKLERREEMIERIKLLFINDQRFGPFLEEMAGIVRHAEN